MYKNQRLLAAQHGQLGGLTLDGVGVRLAQQRGEQASNTNQGDLVMDMGPTERALCLLHQLLPSHASHIHAALCAANSSLVKQQKGE